MPIENTQDEYKIRSIDTVHINPSIMEGEFLYTGLLGPNRAVEIVRFPPVNLVAPTLSGDFKLPTTITINPGVWDGSPAPYFEYELLSDGVVIDQGSGKTYVVGEEYDATAITARVTAISNQGEVEVVSSNSIDVSIVEPIVVGEQDFFAIQGLNQYQQQNMYVFRNMVLSGMWVEGRFDTIGYTNYYTSGMWVEARADMMGYSKFVVEGLQIPDTNMVYDHDLYTVHYINYVEDLALVNPDAESGTSAGWTFTGGAVETTTGGRNGGGRFQGGSSNTYSSMVQDVSLPVSLEADVDNNLILMGYEFWQSSFDGRDEVEFYLEYLDASNNVLGESLRHGPNAARSDTYWLYQYKEPTYVPALTRTVRVHINFDRNSGSNNDGRIDDIVVKIWSAA